MREFDDNRRISVTEDTLHCEEPDSDPCYTLKCDEPEYAGRGYTTLADAWLAASMATGHQQARRLASEELSRVA